MLKLNISKHSRLRQFPNSAAFLRTKGISNWRSHSLTKQNRNSISFDDLETLCELFQCTPNDLFEWVPADSEKDAETHPLAVLNSDKNTGQSLSKLSYAQLKELEKIISAKEK